MLKSHISELEDAQSHLRNVNAELEDDLHNEEAKIHSIDDAIPIKAKGGQSSWPHYVWELILEQLIAGTPPSSINADIVLILMLKAFSCNTKFKELPSIWIVDHCSGVSILLHCNSRQVAADVH
jgi:hypothetical protein